MLIELKERGIHSHLEPRIVARRTHHVITEIIGRRAIYVVPVAGQEGLANQAVTAVLWRDVQDLHDELQVGE